MELRQYQVVLVSLDPTIGSEIRKRRPCIIISPFVLNKNLSTVTIVPITSTDKNFPTRTPIKLKNKISYAAIDQIRTIDKKRIIEILPEITVKEQQQLKAIIKSTFVD